MSRVKLFALTPLPVIGALFLFDLVLHPQAYLPSGAEVSNSATANDIFHPDLKFVSGSPISSPPVTFVEDDAAAADLDEEGAQSLTEGGVKDLSVEEVQESLRNINLSDHLGARVSWPFIRSSRFCSIPLGQKSDGDSAYLPVESPSGFWFAFEATGIVEDGSWRKLDRALKTQTGWIEGTLEGVMSLAPVGPTWNDVKTIPYLVDMKMTFSPGSAASSQDEETAQENIQMPTKQDPVEPATDQLIEVSDLESDKKKDVESDFQIEHVSEKERKSTLAAGPGFAWSLRHTLYENDEWVLEDREYDLLANWGKEIAGKYRTFDDEENCQKIIAEYVALLGPDLARRTGILFNDEKGLPLYRWPPLLQQLDAKQSRSESASRRPHPKIAKYRKWRKDRSEPAVIRKREDPVQSNMRDRTSPQELVFEFLMRGGERFSELIVESVGGSQSVIIPLEEDRVIPSAEPLWSALATAAALDESPHKIITFRRDEFRLADVRGRFGKADKMVPGVYPRLPDLSGESLSTRDLRDPTPSIVWHEYQGIRVARTDPEEESGQYRSNSVLVQVDLAKWKRLRKKRLARGR